MAAATPQTAPEAQEVVLPMMAQAQAQEAAVVARHPPLAFAAVSTGHKA